MALGNLFQLAKLTITPQGSALGGAMAAQKVQFNPDAVSVQLETTFQSGIKTGGDPLQRQPRKLTLALVFDGSHVDHVGIAQLTGLLSVGQRVKAFLDLGEAANRDADSYLQLTWSKDLHGLEGFNCRLQSVDIKYTAFNRDGSPLRAELQTNFVEWLSAAEVARGSDAAQGAQSRIVGALDTLTQLCTEVYGKPDAYQAVARANDLDDLRSPPVGQSLVFPPLASLG